MKKKNEPENSFMLTDFTSLKMSLTAWERYRISFCQEGMQGVACGGASIEITDKRIL